MKPSGILSMDDFVARVREVAHEHGAADTIAVSLPALAARSTMAAEVNDTLLAFVYHSGESGQASNPTVYSPFARILLLADGTLVLWREFAKQEQPAALGPRFEGDAAAMKPGETVAFIETYYELLTHEEGLLFGAGRPNEEIRRDTAELFRVFAEQQFLPLYERYAGGFLRAIGVHAQA